MSLLDGLRHRIGVFLRGERYAADVEREMRFHNELDALARTSGTSSDLAAELVARRALGNTTYYREEVRAMTSLRWLDRVRQDAGYAWRGLLRTPAFTATVVATLGLGIGVNAAMYSFLDRVFVRPPAGVVDPRGAHRLYIQSARLSTRSGRGVFGSFSYPRFTTLRDRFRDTIQVAVYSPSGGTLLKTNNAQDSVRSSFVSPEYFAVLRLRPRIGRFFAAEESRLESETPVAVISDALWHRSFAADPGIVGRVIELKTKRYTVIGVAPPDFTGIDINRVDVWLPLNCFGVPPRNGQPWYAGTGNYFRAIARVETAPLLTRFTTAGTAALRNNVAELRPDTTMTLLTGPLTEASGPADNDPSITVSARIGAVAFIVLLIACANVANMLLLRASSRRREIAVRRALGVSTARLYEQLVTESVLLGLLSGAVALLFSTWGAPALRGLLLPTIHWATAAVDLQVAAVTVGVAFTVGFLLGLFPAAMASAVDLADALKAGSRPLTGRRSAIAQSSLLVVQAALSVVLLVGAGLFIRSLHNVQSIDLGYDPEGLIVSTTYIRDEQRAKSIGAEFANVAERLRTKPGITAVGLSSGTPMGGYAISGLFVPGRDSAVKSRGEFPTHFYTSPGYFDASGVNLVAGRDFNTGDRIGSPSVIIVGQRLAAEVWPGESPLGKCLKVAKPTNECSIVVGVAEDVHRMNIIEAAGTQFYLPLAQSVDGVPSAIVVRARGAAVTPTMVAMRAELLALMPDQSDWSVRSMGQVLGNEMRPWRMGAILFAGLGVLALIVAAIGIYGVVAYAISQRTQEMGIRIALGAQTKDILDLVLAHGLRVVLAGVAIGVGAALLLGRLVASQLFGVVPHDPSILIIAVVTMCGLAGVACLIPGWRAAHVDPVTSLRAE